MKIGIDARMYGSKQGGLGRYIEQLISGLEELDKDNQYFIFLRSENWNEYCPKNPNFTKIMADISWYGLAEQTIWPLKLYRQRLDLMHFPHWNVPLLYFSKFLVTIHDLLLFHYPTKSASTLGPISYFIKNLLFRLVLTSCSYRAKKIITVSEYSKKDIANTLRINPKKITVTYPTVNLESKKDSDNSESVLLQYGIKKPFWLYVGVAYPHKNLEKLIKAFNQFFKENPKYSLVLVGKNNYFYNRLKKISEKENSKNIIFTDYVKDADLHNFYRLASLYVFPSLYEGFGIPPLEAASHGLPIISSDRTSMPEVLGDGALFFDPDDANQMVTAAKSILNDENLRKKIVFNAKNNLKKYSLKTLAQKTLDIYKST